MIFINPENEYPRFIGDLQLEHEDWQIGDALPEGWVEVLPSELPEHDSATETIEELAPVKRNGKFYQAFQKRNRTTEELNWLKREAIKAKIWSGEPLTAEEAEFLTR
jgi:hypothetical protein